MRYQSVLLGMLLFITPLISFSTTSSATIGITANVLAACSAGTIAGGTTIFGTFNFGTQYYLIYPVAVTGAQNAGAISVQCANQVPYKIVLSAGNSGIVSQRYMKGTATPSNHVNYNLYTDPAHMTIWDDINGLAKVGNGTQQNTPVYGLLPAQNTPAKDTYTDIITVTVSW